MIVGVSTGVFVVLLVLAFVGAAVQGYIGFGFGVIAAPVVAFLAPELIPAALIIGSIPLPFMTLAREGRSVDWRALGWIMVGTLPATLLGAWIVAAVPARVLQVIVGIVVLLVAVLPLFRIEPRRGPATLISAGAISSLGGTTASIGGPPIAIVLRNDTPSRARATMAVYFLMSTVVTLASLAAVGRLSATSWMVGLSMLPATLLGFGASILGGRRFSDTAFGAAVVGFSTLAAVILLIRAVI
ncbi:sulfite exporter TauE/SafE family protein [Propioniciclava coleopterorum]|uniref:Probable membrane transporter protein n=1 Tax=Propioniciclava coleopterorum TaxID=2714937 RepID=A0A6G7Y5A9_9ACTN|nr:sulfite exporter TauE/SafE family protein [Propioniciclava coleopterorum]QIK72000.1 sulfite exporter TauE/SafE family protein [Propioniciclava coleopterorum]